MSKAYGDQNGKSKSSRKLGGVAGSDNADFRGYINLNLSQEQKADFSGWWETESPYVTLEACVADGVNLALKRDLKGDCFLGSATQRNPESPNAGLCVTARGTSASVAWSRLLYCLWFLSRSPRWEDTQPIADPDRW